MKTPHTVATPARRPRIQRRHHPARLQYSSTCTDSLGAFTVFSDAHTSGRFKHMKGSRNQRLRQDKVTSPTVAEYCIGAPVYMCMWPVFLPSSGGLHAFEVPFDGDTEQFKHG